MSVRRVLPMIVGVAFALCTFGVVTENVTAQSSPVLPKIRMLTPKKGQVFRPGDRVTITWEFVWPPGKREDPSLWCEQEIFLSLDGGKTTARRLTLQLSPTRRSYEWTVPNTPTDRAVLDIHYGCETSNSPLEMRNVQKELVFRILKPSKHVDEVQIAKLPSRIAPGEVIQVRWDSTVRNPGIYKVYVSYDRGAEFTQIGETYGTSFDWAPSADYRGTLVFRVGTEAGDGSVIESAHELPNVVRVQ